MTKMATMPIYGKNPVKIFFSETSRLMTLQLCVQHLRLRHKQFYTNDDPGLTLTFCRARSDLFFNAFIWENVKTVDFIETIDFYELKISTYSLLSEYMNTYKGITVLMRFSSIISLLLMIFLFRKKDT